MMAARRDDVHLAALELAAGIYRDQLQGRDKNVRLVEQERAAKYALDAAEVFMNEYIERTSPVSVE